MLFYLFCLFDDILMSYDTYVISDIFIDHLLVACRECIMILKYPFFVYLDVLDACFLSKFPLGRYQGRFTIFYMSLGESSVFPSQVLDEEHFVIPLLIFVYRDNTIGKLLDHTIG
jgi:hypothetical protein